MIPEDLRYTTKHEWVASRESASTVRVGITDYAQDALGDVVYVQLPEVGAEVTAGEPLGEIESTKSANEIYAPVSGTVVARNDELDAKPELVNSDPYGEGWMFEVEPDDPGAADRLLTADQYRDQLG